MLTTQRKQMILAQLKREGQVVAKDVAEAVGVSEDTIRRDLREMAAEGLLQRVHGGALPASPAVADFAGRELITPEGKVAIGRAAAGMIREGQVVILDGGTTARQVARHIPLERRATVVTHSPTIALELVEHPHLEVILLGGAAVQALGGGDGGGDDCGDCGDSRGCFLYGGDGGASEDGADDGGL